MAAAAAIQCCRGRGERRVCVLCRGAVVPPVLSSVFSAGARGEGLRGGGGGWRVGHAIGQRVRTLSVPPPFFSSPPPLFSYRVLVRTICFLAGPYCLVVLEGLITCRIGRNHFFFLPFVFSFTFSFLFIFFSRFIFSICDVREPPLLCAHERRIGIVFATGDRNQTFICLFNVFFILLLVASAGVRMCVSLGGTPFTRVQFGKQRRGAFTLRWHS